MKATLISSLIVFVLLSYALQATSFFPGPEDSENPDCDSLSITLISQQDITCFQNYGYVEVEGAGGVIPYTYQWSIPGSELNYIEVNVSDLYSVTITDANDCTISATYAIYEIPGPVIDDIYITPESCPGACDAQIEISGSGGTLPYMYSIQGDGCSGFHLVTLTDAEGCSDTQEIFIWEVDGPVIDNINIIHASPGTENGVIEIDAQGNGALLYSIDGTFYQASNVFTGLAAGAYTIFVMDENGCIVAHDVIIVELTSTSSEPHFELKIYPNPSDDILMIESGIPLQIQVADLAGNVLISRPNAGVHQISTSHLIPGMYLIKISNGEDVGFQKLIII